MKSTDDVKGRTKEFDGKDFKFYPQNNISDVTTVPTIEPTTVPTQIPTVKPTTVPTQIPTVKPTAVPTQTPTTEPTTVPTVQPTAEPTIPSTTEKKEQKMSVDHKSLTLYVGGKATTLKVSNTKGNITYKSSDPKVAKVSEKGKVTPRSAGKATITITAAGDSSYKAATLRVKVTVNKQKQKMTVTPKSLKLYAGGEKQSLKASNAKGNVTYVSSKSKVAKVNSSGKITPLSKGTATITVKAAGNKSYKAAAVKVNVTVYGRPAAVKKVKAERTNKNLSLKVTWKKVPSASGYIIRYSYYKNMKNSRTIKASKNAISETVENLQPKKGVYVKVQAYAKKGGITIPGDWSKTVKGEPVKVKTASENSAAK